MEHNQHLQDEAGGYAAKLISHKLKDKTVRKTRVEA